MSDPLIFDDVSPRFALPLLFSAQAQKEAFVNEAISRIDGLLHPVVEDELATPPTAPVDGQSWLVANAATGEWAGRAGQVACRQGGNWLYVEARDGMRLFNLAAGRAMFHSGSWKKAEAIQEPTGGTTVDSEVRTALTQVISALKSLGLLPGA